MTLENAKKRLNELRSIDTDEFQSLEVKEMKSINDEMAQLEKFINDNNDKLEFEEQRILKRKNFDPDIAQKIANGDLGTVTRTFKSDNMKGVNNLNTDIRDTKEYRNAFINTIKGIETVEERNLVGTTSGMGAVIPTNVFGEVLDNIQKTQGVLEKVRILNIPGNLNIPVSDINSPAKFKQEGELIESSLTSPEKLSLTGFELAKIFTLSQATRSMAVPQFEDYLVKELVRTTGDALNDAVYNGTGVGEPTGLEHTDLGDRAVETADFKLTDLTTLLGKLAGNFRARASYVMSSTTYYSKVLPLLDGNAQPYFKNEENPLGKEIILDDFVKDGTIFLFDPQYYFFNFSSPMAIERDVSSGFTRAVTHLRSLSVVDGKVLPESVAKLTITA